MVRREKYAPLLLAAGALLLLVLLWMLPVGDAESGGLCINEFVASSNVLLTGENEDGAEWIELYNGSSRTVNLAGYGLSDDPDDPFQFVFGDVEIQPGGYLLAATTREGEGLENALLLNFKLSARGGCLVLTSPEGETVDRFEYQNCYREIPYGRAGDGGAPALLNKATPGYSNTASLISRYVTETVETERAVFSHLGGFYEEPFDLRIQHPEGTTVYYTTDGSVPDLSSAVYSGPIRIEDISSQPNRYAGISTTYDTHPLRQYGAEPVTKGTVIRARICRDGYLSEYTEDATYFVGQTPAITTVSLITDPDNLFDYYDGIYVSGYLGRLSALIPYDENAANNYIGNYTLRGKETARPVHVEFFAEKGEYQAEGQNGELRLNGGPTGSSQVCKPFRLYATSKYGDADTFAVDFTWQDERSQDLNLDPNQVILRVKRNMVSGMLQDVIGTIPFLNEDSLYVQSFEPIALYVNGEYWGAAALRDRITPKSIAQRFDLGAQEISLVKYNDRNIELIEGTQQDLEEYIELQNYPLSHDMTTEESYQYIAQRVDLDSFIRQQLVHIYFANCDWPDNNIRAFRSQKTDENNPYADGRWRYVLFDLDLSFMDWEHNTLLYAMGLQEERAEGWDYDAALPEWSTSLFRGLMDNSHFRQQFLEVYQEYRETVFQPEYLTGLLDQVLTAYGDEWERHIQRWTATPNLFGAVLGAGISAPQCEEDLELMREFIQRRPSCMDSFLEEFYAGKGETIQWH